MIKAKTVSLALLISALSLIACGNSASNAISQAGNVVPGETVFVPEFTFGSYIVQIGQQDLPPSFVADSVSYSGEWTLDFGEKGLFALSQGSLKVVTGEYLVEAGIITFTGKSWEVFCPASANMGEAGIYGWSATGSSLTMVPLEESCNFRRQILSSYSLAAREGNKIVPNFRSIYY